MTKRNAWRRNAWLMFATAALFVLAPAGAQADVDPSCEVYGTDIPGSAAEECIERSNGEIGALPFTGLDLLILAGIALVLTGTGFALRRLSTPSGPAT